MSIQQPTQKSLIIHGNSLNCLSYLPSNSIQCAITSPPYWGLRDYNVEGQVGLESSLEAFITNLVTVFNEVKRILKDDGTLWLNIGDSYTSGDRKYRAADKKNKSRGMSTRPDTPTGLKPKDLIGIPWRLAMALQDAGWYLRSDIIWNKPNAMPESVKDRPYRNHEYIFLFSKSEKYYFDENGLIDENGKKRRTVWTLESRSKQRDHPAVFPSELIKPCLASSTKEFDKIIDPFFGSGTLGEICVKMNRRFIGVEINKKYINMAAKRFNSQSTLQLNARELSTLEESLLNTFI